MSTFKQDMARIHALVFSDDRVFQVSRETEVLLRQRNIKPPPPGQQFVVPELDAKLAGLDEGQRLQCKVDLNRNGLLPRQ